VDLLLEGSDGVSEHAEIHFFFSGEFSVKLGVIGELLSICFQLVEVGKLSCEQFGAETRNHPRGLLILSSQLCKSLHQESILSLHINHVQNYAFLCLHL
jgi:hypothetical protein